MEIQQKWQIFAEKLQQKRVGRTNLNDVLSKASMFLFMLVFIPILFSGDQSYKNIDMKIGSIATKKVVAPFNFFILKTEKELKKEREEAVAKVPFYFNYNGDVSRLQHKRLSEVIPYLSSALRKFSAADTAREARAAIFIKIKDELQQNFNIEFSETNLRIIFDIIRNEKELNFLKQITTVIDRELEKGILSLRLSEITRSKVVVIRNGVEEELSQDEWTDSSAVQKQVENTLLEHFDVNQTVILNYFFSQLIKPNLIYDRAFTQNAVKEALNNVSRTKDMVYENERIVDANERIDADIYQKLYSLKTARIERSRREGNWPDRFAYIAKMMLLAVILLVGGVYLSSFRKRVFKDNKRLLMIVIILLLDLILASVITKGLNWHAYLIPTTIASMLLAILMDSGIGLIGTVVLAFIVGGIQGGGYDLALLTFIAGMAGVYSVHRIRTRNQVFKAIVFIMFAYFWLVLTLTALRYDSLLESMKIFAYYLIPNSILSPFITFMLLGPFEKFFDITTDITLLELSDLNHPLLKELLIKAPGTFHHSMVVGNLAESAAKEIGANPLLARVGSYYHDIGKMEKPEYFVENQMEAENRHNQLSPNMSALILASHVKSGIELAEKNGIPKKIQDFIPEHHGTNIMTYFYNKAKENAGEAEINAADFRYPGPRPQSRETGIVMLADAVEAATRTVKNPTPNKLRAAVENIVDQRFKDGELDECDLTLRNLKTIVDAFMPVLQGVFQHRIEYPEPEKKKTAPKQQKKKTDKDENNHSPKAG